MSPGFILNSSTNSNELLLQWELKNTLFPSHTGKNSDWRPQHDQDFWDCVQDGDLPAGHRHSSTFPLFFLFFTVI